MPDRRGLAVDGVGARPRPLARREPVHHGVADPRGFANGPAAPVRTNARRLPVARDRVRTRRFDGVRAIPWCRRAAHFPTTCTRSPRGARRRALDRYPSGLASWDGRSSPLTAFGDRIVNALVEDRDGTLWVGGQTSNAGLVCAIRGATAQCDGGDGSLGKAIASLYEDSKGVLWAPGAIVRGAGSPTTEFASGSWTVYRA